MYIWVNEWHQPIKDYEDTAHEDIVDLMQARMWIQKREDRQNKKNSKSQNVEDAMRRKAGFL